LWFFHSGAFGNTKDWKGWRKRNMVGKIKLNVNLIDKHKIFRMKGIYDPETRLMNVRRSVFSRDIMRFVVDPDHIYEVHGLKSSYLVFVDNAKRESVNIERVKKIIEDGKKTEQKVTETVEAGTSFPVHSDDPVDLEKANTLDVHSERAFWKALLQQTKIPLSTTIILLLAGVGIYHFLLMILRAFGVQV